MTSSQTPRFVVVDDDPGAIPVLCSVCHRAGFEAVSFTDVQGALKAIRKHVDDGSLAGVVTDLIMPGSDGKEYGGWEVLQGAYSLSPRLALAAYTAHFEEYIIRLFRSGAALTTFRIFDKPGQLEDLSTWLRAQYDRWHSRLSIILQDASTAEIYQELAPIYARSELPILILGDTGTGKEGLARHIHNESGRKGPFVPVNCGGLEPSVAFAELYGYQQGAFTDASHNEIGFVLEASGYTVAAPVRQNEDFMAWLRRGNTDLAESTLGDLVLWSSDIARDNAGTLFLDEVGSLPPKVMAGLLRILSTHDLMPMGYHGKGVRAYCRLIAATNERRVLETISKGGSDELPPENAFRADLYYRLNGAVLQLAALKDRDPREIERFFESPFSWNDIGVGQMPVESAAVKLVQELFHHSSDPVAKQYQNGNFRSLRNLLHRAALIARSDRMEGPPVISERNMKQAIENGMLTISEYSATPVPGDVGEQIRRQFRDSALARGVVLRPQFSRQDLREATSRSPELVAAALLDVLILHRELGHPTTYYDQKEVEAAIYRGFRGGTHVPSSYLNKMITAEHFKKAAVRFFGVPAGALSESNTIKDLVGIVRSRGQGGDVKSHEAAVREPE